jgi:membrane protease YdiL (CAAX protease family)
MQIKCRGVRSGDAALDGADVRRYLVPRLLDTRVPWPLVLSGLAWSVWHWPLVLRVQGPFAERRLLTLVVFTAVVITVALAMARLHLASGSLLPPILLHGVWNEALSVFDGATPSETLWLGESGVLVLLASLLLLWPLLRGSWGAERAEGELFPLFSKSYNSS